MGRSLRGEAAIVGVADAASPTGELDTRGRVLEAAMIREALDDAGLTLADVDGICCSGIATGIAEYLDLRPRFVDGTFVGGSSFEVHVEHAAAAIAAGLCEVVVGVYASTPRLDRRLGTSPASFGPMGPDVAAEWEAPYGSMVPMTSYALAADRHMTQFGTTAEQLAQIAVDTRRWAAMNPRARYQDPITVDDVLTSPVVASPLHQLDCCLRTDGAGAYVLTSAERARDLGQPPAYVLGAATATDHWVISQMPDLTVTPGARSGPAAFAHAGITTADVDVLEAYDSFTITALLHLEDLGFCAKGEGGALPWCTDCGVALWYPRTTCPSCFGSAVEWRDDAGTGTVYAVSVHTRPGPGRDADDGPYVVVLVDLDAGVRMMSNVVGSPPEDVNAGMRVTLAWEPLSDGRHLPVFRLSNQVV